MDFGKYKYQEQKKINEAKKKQVQILLKEVKLRPSIDVNDLNIKLRKAQEFLEDGDRVKFIMQFRGRELAHKDRGMMRFKSILTELILRLPSLQIDQEPNFEKNTVIAVTSLSKKVKRT